MAKHAILTKRNERIVAAVATSGLLATGITLPIPQVALGATVKVGSTCTITSNGLSQTALRQDIEAAIADTDCETVVINHEDSNSQLDLEVSETPIYVGPSATTADARRSLTIKSTTGLNIMPSVGDSTVLMELEDELEANFFDDITIEGLTFRDARNSAIDGRLFGNSRDTQLHINNSRFIDNGNFGSESNGGAIQTFAEMFVTKSIFVGNYANDEGGAIWSNDDIWIDQSLFVDNMAEFGSGGAVHSDNAATYAGNSTFVGSNSAHGGAIWSYGDIELVLNTFDNNLDDGDFPPTSSAYSGNGNTRMWGNIFSNDPSYEGAQVVSWETSVDLGYNIFTTSPVSWKDTTSLITTRAKLAFDELDEDEITVLRGLKTPVTFAPVLALTNRSVAAGFIKGDFPLQGAFDSFFNETRFVDQLGEPRTSSVAAGAHQMRKRSTGSSAPAVVAQSEPKRITVPGFAANSTKLTRPMRAEIRKFLRANPGLTEVVCRGFTSSPATAKDRVLARNRGKVTCDYIKTLRPEANVTIRSGSHTNKPGKQIRRVSITLR